MVSWPELGTRVTVRYRRPAGSVPPLTDVVGHLLETTPQVRMRTKAGAVIQVDPAAVIALRTLSDAPVRASQIRALEHAAALAWPGIEQQWLDGWLLRSGHGITRSANSAVPLDRSASASTIPAIADWYRRRGLVPRLAVPDRLSPASGWYPQRLLDPGEDFNRVLTGEVRTAEADASISLSARPDAEWLRHHDIPEGLLTAVIDGEVAFARHAQATARAAVTNAPDGTRWVGLSALRTADHRVCQALLAWGSSRGATRGYLRVRQDDHLTANLGRSLGFTVHHHARYITVAALT